MKFELIPNTIPTDFIKNTQKKVELYGLDLPISPALLEELCNGNERCEKALHDMFTYAIRYASDVWSMKEFLMRKSEYTEDEWATQLAKVDTERTQLHNTLIDSIAILSRSMVANGIETEWLRELAPTGKLERARCGKFAIMLTYWIAVNRKG